MKKTTKKINAYSSLFLTRTLVFNVALAFAIVSLVFIKDGFTSYAITAIAVSGTWILIDIITHLIWIKMSVNERGLYLAIRRHGKGIVEISSKEVKGKGQRESLELLNDMDAGLEVQMIMNGTGPLIHIFVGIKWFMAARHFNKHEGTFDYEIK